MNIPIFFKFLNKKIEQYDKIASNPFTIPRQITLIWIEDCEISSKKSKEEK